MREFRLGGLRAGRVRNDAVRDGAVTFISPRGLDPIAGLLADALPKRPPSNALFGMDTEAAPALCARAIWPDAEIAWFHLDAYVARKVRGVLADNDVEDVKAEALEDPPGGPFDLIALPLPGGGERLLARDLLEAAHDRLRMDGRLVVATDKTGASLPIMVKKVFGNVVPCASSSRKGAAFYASRRKETARSSDHSHVLTRTIAHAGDDDSTELVIETRPGTFSHGRLDRGTRALMEWLDPRDADSILDIGAGCGALGIYAAKRVPEAQVILVDSNARAVGCARRNADRNGVSDRLGVSLRADLEDLPPGRGGGHALALSNPPYFGSYRIVRSFLDGAYRTLRPGGRFVMVVKEVGRHAEHMRGVFRNGGVTRVGEYSILCATRLP